MIEGQVIVLIAVEEYTSTLKGKGGMSPAKPETQQKAGRIITAFKEHLLSERGKTIPDESDIEEYRHELELTDGSKRKSATVQKITYIRGYFALNEERSKEHNMTDEMTKEAEILTPSIDDETSTENTQACEEPVTLGNEPLSWPEGGTINAEPKKRNRKNGEKKVPVSVYLEPETHRIIKAISDLTHKTIGDIAASTLSEFAKKNAAKVEAKATEVQAALDAVKKAMENFTLEY